MMFASNYRERGALLVTTPGLILYIVQHFYSGVLPLLWHLSGHPNGNDDAVKLAPNLQRPPDQPTLEECSRYWISSNRFAVGRGVQCLCLFHPGLTGCPVLPPDVHPPLRYLHHSLTPSFILASPALRSNLVCITFLGRLHIARKVRRAGLSLGPTRITNFSASHAFEGCSNLALIAASLNRPSTRCCRVGHSISTWADLMSIRHKCSTPRTADSRQHRQIEFCVRVGICRLLQLM